jgi:pilus assembly protein CpaF
LVFSIVITEKGGAQRQLDIESPEISIGRLEDNDICLPKSNVSKHHARLVFKDERYVLLDQKSTNGTYVNGRRISAPMVVRKGDKIYIGDFILTLAAPGGTFEGVSAREFRPRRAISDPVTEMAGATDPPKPASPTKDEMRVPSDMPLGSSAPPAEPAALPSLPPPPPSRPSVPPSSSGSTTAVSSTAPGQSSAGIPVLPQPRNSAPAASQTARSIPPPLPSSPARVTVPPPTRAKAEAAAAAPRATVELAAGSSKSVPGWSAPDANPLQSGLTSPAVLAPSLRLQGALAMLMERLATEMNVARAEESAFPSEHSATLERLIDELAAEGAIGPDLDRRFLREAAISEAVGLGPLDRLLSNRSVRELVVDGPTRILADLGGGLTPVSTFFSDDSAVLVIARRLLHRAGRKLDESAAVQEARLPSGGFLQLLLPPLAAKGPLITVRCPPRAQSSPESLVTEGVLSGEMLAYLRSAVQQRKNILVIGAMGSGVSSLLGVLTMLAADHERIVTIENAPSASLVNAQTLPLSRHAKPDLSLEDFLKYASRLRHDRLMIDDIGPADVLAALSAAAANPGLLLGMHAPTPETALLQLELFAQAALGGVRTSLAPLLASALQIIVHIASSGEGTRRVQGISEVRANKSGVLELSPRFRFDNKAFAKA